MIRSGLIGIAAVFTVFWGAGPVAPQAPQGTGAPFVKSVSFYYDWQLTQPIDTAVEPETTIYTKIVFSEPMKLKVAADDTARPILYYHIGGEGIRYRIAGHGASGADFVSGDAKPLQSGTDDYVCKYTIPEDATGQFAIMVGKFSTNLSGNTLENFYIHPVRLGIGGSRVPLVVNTVGRTPNTPQPTSTPVDQPASTAVNPETLIDLLDTADTLTFIDTTPGETLRDEAFLFRKFIEQLISDKKELFVNLPEEAFQPPGKGFIHPARGQFGLHFGSRGPDFHVLGTFIPDPITYCTTQQINDFSAKYQLTKEELIYLLRNLYDARIIVWPVGPWVEVWMPDRNLRKAVVAEINRQGISMGPINRPKESFDPIYQGEMWQFKSLKAEAAGIIQLRGLEHAFNLEALYLGNILYQDWDLEFVRATEDEGAKYKITEPETPNKILDLRPLKHLYHLTILDLSCNAVSDLTPLENLTGLRWLNLPENKIHFIFALEDLTNLAFLNLRNHYYSPLWAGNNDIRSLSPLRKLINLTGLYVDQNPIGRSSPLPSLGVLRNFPKLNNLSIGCCGVSDFRSLVECPGLRGTGSYVYLVYSPITEGDLEGPIKALRARGVGIEDGVLYTYDREDKAVFETNQVEKCSVSFRESFRAAPALQLPIEPGVLSSVWHDLSQIPEKTSLMPNYPNPFNPETWIPYQLAMPGEVTVAIHAADGRLVRTLPLGHQPAGVYQSKGRAAYWDGRNAQGEPVASAVYFYTLMAGDFTATRKMLIRK